MKIGARRGLLGGVAVASAVAIAVLTQRPSPSGDRAAGADSGAVETPVTASQPERAADTTRTIGAATGGEPRERRPDDNWTRSIAWVCREHPGRVEKLFGALDLTRDGLQDVSMEAAAHDWPAACARLLDYYRHADSGAWLRKAAVPAGDDTDPRAQGVVDGVARLYSVESRIRTTDGHVDWTADGGTGDNEWNRALHRHAPLAHLFWGYRSTGNRRYVEQLDADLIDWIVSSPYRSRKGDRPQWGGLETCIRARYWAEFFYELMDVPEFSPAARILMLSSLPDHAHFLKNFHEPENWTMNQMVTLATIAVAWPEFARAGEWLNYSEKIARQQFEDSVYPDGAQNELTALYHSYITGYYDTFVSLLARAGHPAPPGMEVARMYDYMAGTMRPDGRGPRNNDAEDHNTRIPVMDAAGRYGRPDWEYIASNGRSGRRPEGPPSRVFPWAGQVVMRSGYDADAQWAFFDVGPWGAAHQHNDKLHLSVSAFGRNLLVDPGRYTYEGGEMRDFFTGSAAHNVLLVDGYPQTGDVKTVDAPLASDTWRIEPAFDYARGTYGAGFLGLGRDVTHTRAVLYLRGIAWVVVDRIVTTEPRDVTALWHFHPDCTVTIDGGTAVTTDAGKGNLRVAPVAREWRVQVVSGSEDPVQGWYSIHYNRIQPSPVAVFETRIDGTSDFAWILLPARGTPAAVDADLVEAGGDEVTVRFTAGNERHVVTVPIAGGEPTAN